MSMATENPATMTSQAPPNMSQGPIPTGVQPPPPPPPRQDPNAFPLRMAGGGGMSKAFERELRGPSLLAAQGARNQASEDTIDRVSERNQQMAQQEYEHALDQERQARVREQATQQSMIERQQELEQRTQEFDTAAQQLAKAGQLDQNRWFASRSTPQKVAAFVELALTGARRSPSMVMKAIGDDVKAQEFAYYATKDAANAKQTAFAMAMQKYQNADAARAMATAAGAQVAQNQLAAISAKWKGTEAANKADIAHAALQDEKMMQIASGVQFVPSQYRGRQFVDPRTGLVYSEAEAKALMGKLDEHAYEERKQTAGIGGQLLVEGAKADAALAGKADEGARHISSQLQTAGVPQARLAADEALAALQKSPGGSWDAAARWALGSGDFANKVMSDDSNAREQKYQAFANAAMKAMMGNVTASEEERARKQFGSANDPASRERAINSALATLSEIEKNAKAGESPAAQRKFEAGREAAKGDRDLAPPGGKSGW